MSKSKKICTWCLILDSQHALQTCKKSHRRFWISRLAVLRDKVINSRDVRSLHSCSNEHKEEVLKFRKQYGILFSKEFHKHYEESRSAIISLSREEKKLQMLTITKGSSHPETRKCRAMIHHYKILTSQRLRRLREVYEHQQARQRQSKENTELTMEILDRQTGRSPSSRIIKPLNPTQNLTTSNEASKLRGVK